MATHSCLENPVDRGAQRATVHGVAKSQTVFFFFKKQTNNNNKNPMFKWTHKGQIQVAGCLAVR